MLRHLLVTSLLLAACHEPWPVDTPAPAVQPAPPELRGVAIHVHRLVTPTETEQDEWDYHHMPGLTGELRAAFVSQLQRAGYTVVVDRRQPHDLEAVVQAEWPHDRSGTATLVLQARGEVVATLSATIPILGEPPRTEHLEGDAAVSLVHRMNRSRPLAAFVVRRPTDAVLAR